MKHWPSQLFPIVLLSLLAALSFVLERAVLFDSPPKDGKLRHDPDAIAEKITVLRYDQDGRLKYRLVAPLMAHFPDDETSQINDPVLTAYRPEAPPVIMSSRQALVFNKGETVKLWDEVNIRRLASAQRQEMQASTPDLTIETDRGLAYTASPVEIHEGQSWIKGVGMELDNNAATLVLQSRVSALYLRPKATP